LLSLGNEKKHFTGFKYQSLAIRKLWLLKKVQTDSKLSLNFATQPQNWILKKIWSHGLLTIWLLFLNTELYVLYQESIFLFQVQVVRQCQSGKCLASGWKSKIFKISVYCRLKDIAEICKCSLCHNFGLECCIGLLYLQNDIILCCYVLAYKLRFTNKGR
jgi:hypothetical protein